MAEEEIPSLATNLQAELIMLGAQGKAARADKPLGSLSKALLQKSDFPVVCVPPEAVLSFTARIAMMLNKNNLLCNSVGSGYLAALRLQD